jgi:hypothetical protein
VAAAGLGKIHAPDYGFGTNIRDPILGRQGVHQYEKKDSYVDE